MPDSDRATFARTATDYYVTAPCGKCFLCRKRRANMWRLRLINEYESTGKRAVFVTLTFNDASIHLSKDMAVLVRRWRQLYKYHLGVAPRYFFTEDKGTQFGRIHLHGIVFLSDNVKLADLLKHRMFWPYGYYSASYCKSVKAMSYVSSYLSGSVASDVDNTGAPIKHGKKLCKQALTFIPKTYVSKGIGKSVAHSLFLQTHYDNSGNYRLLPFYKVGQKVYPLPRYYRELLFSDYEKGVLNDIYKSKIEKLLYTYKDNPERMKYLCNGVKLDEYGRGVKFREYIEIYEEDSLPVVEITNDESFDTSFIYELNLPFNL